MRIYLGTGCHLSPSSVLIEIIEVEDTPLCSSCHQPDLKEEEERVVAAGRELGRWLCDHAQAHFANGVEQGLKEY